MVNFIKVGQDLYQMNSNWFLFFGQRTITPLAEMDSFNEMPLGNVEQEYQANFIVSLISEFEMVGFQGEVVGVQLFKLDRVICCLA